MVKSRYIGDGHPTFNRNPYNWYIKPHYWVDDHPLLYGNNGSLDPSTYHIKHPFDKNVTLGYQFVGKQRPGKTRMDKIDSPAISVGDTPLNASKRSQGASPN